MLCGGDLLPLWEKLAAHRSRIHFVLPKRAAAHPELILLASMFKHYEAEEFKKASQQRT
jgi:hypothetical protein